MQILLQGVDNELYPDIRVLYLKQSCPGVICNHPFTILYHSRNEMKYLDIHKRYNNLYIPSDFFKCEMSWTKSIRLEDPPRFSPHPITFNILHKDVDIPVSENEALPLENPPDADSRFIVKVSFFIHFVCAELFLKT